jgi:hypothetical protein
MSKFTFVCALIVTFLLAFSSPGQAAFLFNDTFTGVPDGTAVNTLTDWSGGGTIQSEELVVSGQPRAERAVAWSTTDPTQIFSFDITGGIGDLNDWAGLRDFTNGDTRAAVVEPHSDGNYRVRVWDGSASTVLFEVSDIPTTSPLNAQFVFATGASPTTSLESVQVILNNGAWTSSLQALSDSPVDDLNQFTVAGDIATGLNIDNVSLEGVPEPASLLLLSGAALIGLFRFRRR